jgi:hypothetical protein
MTTTAKANDASGKPEAYRYVRRQRRIVSRFATLIKHVGL